MSSVHEWLINRDPCLDEQELLAQVRENADNRPELPPLASVHGLTRLIDERQALLKVLGDLMDSVRDHGLVESHRAGYLGRFELWFKRSLRKFQQRHLLQQQRVNLRLVKTLRRLVSYLELQDRIVRTCIDMADPGGGDNPVRRPETSASSPREPSERSPRRQSARVC